MKRILPLFLFGVLSHAAFSQTPIGGIINSNLTLTKGNSPYLISSSLVIANDGKLTIQPGVEVRFADGATLEVRGDLVAIGTATDSITFTSNATSPTLGSWGGVLIVNPQGATAQFNYTKFSYAAEAITETCCWGGSVSIKNSSFIYNRTALNGYGGDKTAVDNCSFTYNTYALTHADKNVNASTFDHNEYGLYYTGRINVSNSSFTNHTQAALYGGTGFIKNTIVENNNIGVKSLGEGFKISKSVISNNSIGVEISDYDNRISSIDSSKICNNAQYNIVNTSKLNVELYSNCWCTSDSTAIEDKILDGWDEDLAQPVRGLISYEIRNDDCSTVLSVVDKDAPISLHWTLANNPYTLNNNFVVTSNTTLTIDPGVEVRFSEGVILEIRGDLVALGTASDSITFTSSATSPTLGSWGGILIVNPQGATARFEYTRFSYAAEAITETCCWGGSVSIKNSSFTYNRTALSGYGGDKTPVDNCFFAYNTYALTHADKNVNASTFDNNEYGLHFTGRINVNNSSFTNHTQAALYGGMGSIKNTTIENNNIGVKSLGEGFKISKSVISDNSIGVEISDYDNRISVIDSSKICNNSQYNIVNTSKLNVELYSNCWCTADSTAIEDKILDGWDENSTQSVRGLISYEIRDADCNNVLSIVNKNAPLSLHWTVANSPYTISNNFVVTSNATLTIDPGVEVRFAEGITLEIRGDLVAVGTASDSITFTSSTVSPSLGSWGGVVIVNPQGATARFNYTKFSYAAEAITETCCWGGSVSIKNSSFNYNQIALNGYGGNTTPVDSCSFAYNTYAVTQADKNVNASTFDHNEYGLYHTGRINVTNSSFTNHTQAALFGGMGSIKNTIVENNNIGVKSLGEGFEIYKSVISNNTIGVELSDYNHHVSPIDSSQICNNSQYNIINTSSINVELYSNCFCSSDSTHIEDKIFDGWDDSSRGLVDYTLIINDCETAIYNTLKAEGRVTYLNMITEVENENTKGLSFHPNPASTYLRIENLSTLNNISIASMAGDRMYQLNSIADDGSVDIRHLPAGLYVIVITEKNGARRIGKLLVQR